MTQNESHKTLENMVEIGNKVRGLNERVEGFVDKHAGKIAVALFVGAAIPLTLFYTYLSTVGGPYLQERMMDGIKNWAEGFGYMP